MSRQPWWVHPSLLVAGLLYGGNYSVAKYLMIGYIGPYGLNLVRALSAVIIFWLVGTFNKEQIARKDVPLLLMCAFFGASVNIALFLKGLSQTNPVNASLIITTTPLLVLVASRIIRKEIISIQKLVGIAVGLSGAVILINTSEISFESETFTGDITIFLNITCYSLYLVLVKDLMAKYQPVTVLKWIFTIGLVIVGPLGYEQLISVPYGSVTPAGWAAFFYVATATTVFAYYLNVNAIKHVNSSMVGYYTYLQPLFAGFIEVTVSDRAITPEIILSTVLIFVGVFLVGRSK